MSTDTIIWGGIAVVTFLVVAVSGPGMWSDRADYPLIQAPWRLLKKVIAELKKDPPPPSNNGQP